MKRAGLAVLVGAALLATIVWGPAFLTPSVSRARIRTALVSVGPIESTLTASGTVVPEFEQVLAAPLDARVLRILKRPGDKVRKGDPIVQLDVSDSESEVKTIDNKVSIKGERASPAADYPREHSDRTEEPTRDQEAGGSVTWARRVAEPQAAQ